MAKNYRKKKSMYIITSKHLITELSALEYQTNLLFDKKTAKSELSKLQSLSLCDKKYTEVMYSHIPFGAYFNTNNFLKTSSENLVVFWS